MPILDKRIQTADGDVISATQEHLNRISDGFFALDTSWIFTFINDRAAEVICPHGDPKELFNTTIWEQFPKAVGTKFEKYYRRSMNKQVHTCFEEYYPAPLNTWFRVNAYPSDTGLSVYFTDITDERQAAQRRDVLSELGQQSLGVSPGDNSLDQFFADAATAVADTLDMAYCKVLDLDPYDEELLLRQGVGWDDGIVGEATVASNTNSQAGYTLLQEEPVVVTDLDTETRFSGPDLLTSHNVASGISVIIGPPDDPWGILGTHDTHHRNFTQEEVTFVQEVANILGETIQRTNREYQLTLVNEYYSIVRDISHAILDTGRREAVEQEVCDRLVTNDSIEMAWIGDITHSDESIVPSYSAGEGTDYLEEVTIPVTNPEDTPDSPAVRAIHTHEPQVLFDAKTDPSIGPWREALTTRGYRSAMCAPLSHNGILYGILAVYSTEPHTFSNEVSRIVGHLGNLIGHTIHSIDQQKALSDDATVVELEYRNTDAAAQFAPLFHADSPDDISVEIVRTATINDTTRSFIRANGIVPATLIDVFENLPTVESIELVGTDHDHDHDHDPLTSEEPCENCLFVAELTPESVATAVNRHGGRIVNMLIEEEAVRLLVEVTPTTDIGELSASINESYPGSDLLSKRTTEREWIDPEELGHVLESELTPRQRDVIQTAHMAGYFESPRKKSGEEIAEMLEISGATFSQHIRTAQQKILDTIF